MALELFPHAATRTRPAAGPSPFNSIVCGVDASRSGHVAVAQAIAMAGPATALSFVSVHWDIGQGLVRQATIGAERADRALREAVQLAGEAGVDASAELVSARDESRPLLERASHADLLVVGSHGVSRRAGIVLGSTASAALHRATVPVLLARRPPEEAEFPHRVLAASDGSATAERAVALAGDIAHRHRARLTLVSVDAGHPSDRNRVMMHAAEVIERRALRPHILWELGNPAERILVAAEQDSSSLVILGSRGLGGIKALGSVSERVAHRARCSVLVVRPDAS